MAATVCKPPAISRITFNRFVRVRVPLRQKHVRLARTPTPTRTIYAWGFFKENLGLQKPSWLPDFSLHRRQSTLLKFFKNPPDREVYEDILHPDFKMHVGNETYSRQDMIDLMCNRVSPAIPDFSWTPGTDGEVDDEGYAIVEIEPSGHHSGAPLDLGHSYSIIQPSNKRIKLPLSILRVLVVDGGRRLKEVELVPRDGGDGDDGFVVQLHEAVYEGWPNIVDEDESLSTY